MSVYDEKFVWTTWDNEYCSTNFFNLRKNTDYFVKPIKAHTDTSGKNKLNANFLSSIEPSDLEYINTKKNCMVCLVRKFDPKSPYKWERKKGVSISLPIVYNLQNKKEEKIKVILKIDKCIFPVDVFDLFFIRQEKSEKRIFLKDSSHIGYVWHCDDPIREKFSLDISYFLNQSQKFVISIKIQKSTFLGMKICFPSNLTITLDAEPSLEFMRKRQLVVGGWEIGRN